LKKTVSIVLLISLVYQCLGCLGVFAWYSANKQRIAEELCENRDRPELHCNGQCVLMKKLKAMEDDGTNGTGDHASPKVETVVFILPELIIFHSLFIPKSITPIPSNESYHYLFSNDNFRPPRLPSLLI